jgi:L-galactose dehydrogenase
MDYVTLGRTGLRASRVGLGCGGHSRLGLATGGDAASARRVIDAALDLGINFLDTARVYGTENVVGAALQGRREQVILSTKASPGWGDDRVTPEALIESLETSLRRLGTDCIDVFHLHGVLAAQYDYCVDALLPTLHRARDAGKIRFVGITERFADDPAHAMLERAADDGHFDVAMIGFNLLNPSARANVLPRTQANAVGTLIMFAVRRALTHPDLARERLASLFASGRLDEAAVDPSQPLAFLTEDPGIRSLTEAAYRFCRHEPGVDVVLTGTGNVDHLAENVAALLGPPLPPPVTERLARAFGHLDSLSGD